MAKLMGQRPGSYQPGPTARYLFSAMVGMARCAVPARVVAGGTNIRAAMAFQGVAPLHAARTSQRDVPTTLNIYGTSRPRPCSLTSLNAPSTLGALTRYLRIADILLPEPGDPGHCCGPL